MDYENKPAMDLPEPDLFLCFCSCLASTAILKKTSLKKKTNWGKGRDPKSKLIAYIQLSSDLCHLFYMKR